MTTLSSSTQADPLDLERDTADFTFWRQATPGNSYVRGLLPARHANGQCLGLHSFDLDWDEEADHILMPRHRGAAIWQFLGDDWRSRVAWAMQDLGVRTLIEVDDNYLKPHPQRPDQKIAWHRTIEESQRPGESGYSNEMHRLVVPTMDGVIVTTEYLRQRYLEYNDNVYVCPNTVDPDDWPEPTNKPSDVFRIVYSGSQSHRRDIPEIKKALKWASRQQGVEVWVQGVSTTWSFANKVVWTHDLAEYRASLGAFHVGLAPVVPGEWADGKSDLKALEYAMSGVVPFLAREEPYRPWFDKPEFLVESGESSWLDKVKWIVRNQDALPSMLETAREYVLNERTTERNAHRWEEAIHGSA